MRCSLFILFILLSYSSLAQDTQPPYTSAEVRLKGVEQRRELARQSLFSELEFTSIGPSVFSGRVTDLAVHPDDPSIFYAAYASGGLWKTVSNGAHFEPLFDNEAVMTIGDIAVDWSRNIIWVGTGENNSSRSSYSGLGMYKSTDDGKTWEYKGLPESHHIGRIILHPENPDILWVAVLGHLYSANAERGVYKTTDGGDTWTKTLFVDDNSGAIDLMIDPSDANTLYASTWHRERRAWNFVEAGKGSGIYKSTDGGDTWTLMSGENSGFPHGEGAGRIGLAVAQKDGKTTLFAIIDNYFRRPKEKEEDEELLTKDKLRGMSKTDFLKLEEKAVKDFLKNNGFPEKYTSKKVIKMMEEDKIKPLALVEYLEDANSLLFNTPVIGAEVYRSDDGGKTWSKTHEGFLNQVYNSYGYYFGQIRVAPQNPDRLYIYGVPILRSEDGGKTWKNINQANVHVDHHALWVNPKRAGHLVLGNDGGINISYDDGEHWFKCNTPAVGQFYYVAVDQDEPYNVYGGLQDNGVWVGPSTYKPSVRWHNSGQYPYKSIMGGDGMQVAVDTRDNATVYTGLQFGNYFRLNRHTGKRKYITPVHELGERPLRWNWQSPIHLSIHNQDIFYMGSNKLHRSLNKGDDFEAISDDLTTGGRKGDVAFSTLSCIHESPLRFGLLYTGSDDGLIHISKDGGHSWQKISDQLPENRWVSRIQASKYKEGRVYASLNGYRSDDFKAYLYVSEDYGQNWKAIGTSLPVEPINVIKEDPDQEHILYVGTDHGLYISLDRGESFMQMKNGLPEVAVHDVVVQQREKELIIATHGRSFYKASVKEVQEVNEELLTKNIHLFEVAPMRKNRRWGSQSASWRDAFEPEKKISLWSNSEGEATIQLSTEKGLLLHEQKIKLVKGLNFMTYGLTVNKNAVKKYEKELNEEKEEKVKVKEADNGSYYLAPGTYQLKVQKNGETAEGEMVIKK